MAGVVARRLVGGLSRPVFVASPPGDRDRLFVVEQWTGLIRIVDRLTGQIQPAPFLKVEPLATSQEQGLLGLAFHPNFATNGFLYVDFTAPGGQFNRGITHVRRYTSDSRDTADPGSATTVLTIDQPFANHNGGWMAFGPRDGFLYIAMGDGGSAGDPGNRAQNRNELLGKMLRVDVDGDSFPGDPTRNYRIPGTNPFHQPPGGRLEVWAYGLRNPWRAGFDRETGDLYIGDAGQDDFEEIDFQPAASRGGENYGWRLREGRHETGLGAAGDTPLVDPIHEYTHSDGIAVIGGYVYRGSAMPELRGRYFFADLTGRVWSVRAVAGVATELREHTPELFLPAENVSQIASFGQDEAGELYIVHLDPGVIYKLVPDTTA